jgi:hypothetical protein
METALEVVVVAFTVYAVIRIVWACFFQKDT